MTRTRRSRRRRLLVALVAAVLVGLAWRAAPRSPHPVAALPTVSPAGAAHDDLIVEPDDGMQPIYALLGSARGAIDMTMYELADPTAEAVLAAAAQRGVRVRVILDGRLERSHNATAYDFLRSRGVWVRWAPARYFVTHEKTFVVDERVAVVMSLNLASRYYATTRDVAVVDRDPRDVAAIESVFTADSRDRPTGTPAADDLAWSPGQAAADMLALIHGARRSILVESEELASSWIVDALVAAARRGVDVRVVMTYRSTWAAAFGRIAAAGGQVRVLHGESPRYIHAKLLAVDTGTPGERVLIGSQNISDASLLHDRELGIVLLAPPLVDRVAAVIATDAAAGAPWR